MIVWVQAFLQDDFPKLRAGRRSLVAKVGRKLCVVYDPHAKKQVNTTRIKWSLIKKKTVSEDPKIILDMLNKYAPDSFLMLRKELEVAVEQQAKASRNSETN